MGSSGEWEDYFEIQELVAREAFTFKADDVYKTQQWFKALQFYGLSLGRWRQRRNALANIMINGMHHTNATQPSGTGAAVAKHQGPAAGEGAIYEEGCECLKSVIIMKKSNIM